MAIEVVFVSGNWHSSVKKYNNESGLSEAIVKAFNKIAGVKCQKVHGSAYGKPTLDILGSRNGHLFWLEVKQVGKKPTARQLNTMKEWIDCGAIATWTTSVVGAMSFLLADWRQLTEKRMLEGFHE